MASAEVHAWLSSKPRHKGKKQFEPELKRDKTLYVVGVGQEVHNSHVDLRDNCNISGIHRNQNIRQKNILKEAWDFYLLTVGDSLNDSSFFES